MWSAQDSSLPSAVPSPKLKMIKIILVEVLVIDHSISSLSPREQRETLVAALATRFNCLPPKVSVFPVVNCGVLVWSDLAQHFVSMKIVRLDLI